MSAARNTDISILVAEDNETNLRLVLKMLEKSEFKNVVEVRDGVDALALLKEEQFDLVLLDIEMPGVDGVEVALQIRNDPDFNINHDTKIIALTGMDKADIYMKHPNAGIDKFLSKPINRNVLTLAIFSLFS